MKGKALIGALVLAAVWAGAAVADDFDDKISTATDDSIVKDDELGQKDHNITVLKMKAKSGKGSSGTLRGQSSDANMNSVVLGEGSNVRGDIIIIDDSRGGKTNIGGR